MGRMNIRQRSRGVSVAVLRQAGWCSRPSGDLPAWLIMCIFVGCSRHGARAMQVFQSSVVVSEVICALAVARRFV